MIEFSKDELLSLVSILQYFSGENCPRPDCWNGVIAKIDRELIEQHNFKMNIWKEGSYLKFNPEFFNRSKDNTTDDEMEAILEEQARLGKSNLYVFSNVLKGKALNYVNTHFTYQFTSPETASYVQNDIQRAVNAAIPELEKYNVRIRVKVTEIKGDLDIDFKFVEGSGASEKSLTGNDLKKIPIPMSVVINFRIV